MRCLVAGSASAYRVWRSARDSAISCEVREGLSVACASASSRSRRASQETAALRRDLGSEVERLLARDRRIATGGLGWGLAALFMTVLAATCQALATVVS
jgi:hypothetical protein